MSHKINLCSDLTVDYDVVIFVYFFSFSVEVYTLASTFSLSYSGKLTSALGRIHLCLTLFPFSCLMASQ